MEASVFNIKGEDTGKKVVLDDSVFGIEPNDHVIYMDVRQYLANKRQGTHKSKERSEVSGSTKKLGRQKGGGGARRGDVNSPVLVGGGRVFGPKSCNEGCLGYGSCVKVCPFDAIHVMDGVAVVDKERCKACGKCVAVCPKHLISLIPYSAKYAVACSNNQKGAVTTKQCKAGCVGCGICQKNCPNNAVTVKDFNATIDYSLCQNCGICKEKCPRKTINEL